MHSGPERWPDLLQAYLSLAVGRGVALPAQALRRRLGPQLDVLQALGATEPGSPLSVVMCPACYEGHSAEIDYDPATRRSSIFCAEAGRVQVVDEDLATVRPNLRWLPDQLTRLLNINPSPPRRTLIEGVAWWLGDIVVGRTEASVGLAVGMRSTSEIQELIDKLQQRPPLGPGLLLVADGLAPAHIGNLTGYQPVLIEDIVRADGDVLGTDEARLSGWVRAVLCGQAQPTAAQGGRPSVLAQVQVIFDHRRRRGEPFVSKSGEADAIRAEWFAHFPDRDLPGASTVRAHLATPPS